jgi:hypothetical protein
LEPEAVHLAKGNPRFHVVLRHIQAKTQGLNRLSVTKQRQAPHHDAPLLLPPLYSAFLRAIKRHAG